METGMKQYIESEFAKALANFQRMQADAALSAQIEEAVRICVDALRNGHKILFAGNGGVRLMRSTGPVSWSAASTMIARVCRRLRSPPIHRSLPPLATTMVMTTPSHAK